MGSSGEGGGGGGGGGGGAGGARGGGGARAGANNGDAAMARALQASMDDAQGGGGSGASGVRSPGDAERRRALAEAAEQRARGKQGGLKAETRQEMDVRRKKDEMIGRIRANYQSCNEPEPFGLPAASMDALKKHLARSLALSRQRGK